LGIYTRHSQAVKTRLMKEQIIAYDAPVTY